MVKNIKLAFDTVFNSWVDTLDFAINSDRYLIFPLKYDIVCRRCKKKLTVKRTNKFISFLCGCGCRVFYPPNREDLIISNFIKPEERKNGGKK